MFLRVIILCIIGIFASTCSSRKQPISNIPSQAELAGMEHVSGKIYGMNSSYMASGVFATSVVFTLQTDFGETKDFYRFYGSEDKATPRLYDTCDIYFDMGDQPKFQVNHPIKTDAVFAKYIICEDVLY